MEKRNSQLKHREPMEQTRDLFLHVRLKCGSLLITTSVSLLEMSSKSKRFAWTSELGSHQMNLVCNSWVYERFQKSKDSVKVCFENVNI